MKDIELAKNVLYNENQKLVLVKDGEVVFKSKDRGIKPMYILATEMKDRAMEGAIADRVIGKGAALLCTYLKIQEVYGELMSQGGIDILKDHNIKYEIKNSCEYIKNANQTDLCPIEKRSLDIDDPKELLKRIEKFLGK